jgi:hypothetical protein
MAQKQTQARGKAQANQAQADWDNLAAPIVQNFLHSIRCAAGVFAKKIVPADVAAANAVMACQVHLGALEATLVRPPFGFTREAAREVIGAVIDGELPQLMRSINDIRKE